MRLFKKKRPFHSISGNNVDHNASPNAIQKSAESPLDPQVKISLMDYDAQILVERNDISLEECLQYLGTPAITWINIEGVHDASVIERIGKHFKLHPLLIEDIVNGEQRSKLDDYKENLFIIMRRLKYSDERDEVEDEQVSFVLGADYLISFMESEGPIFNTVKERIRNKTSRIRQMGPDYLCYALIDCLVDHYFVIIEKVDESFAKLEDELIERPSTMILRKIQKTKREITLLRKSVWPMREVISHFRRVESPLVEETTKIYLQDVYDHTIQTIDTIESLRDLASGMLDVYLSNISQRLNEVMKVLTVATTIFVPLTFIASIYGMNFDYLPELHYHYGYHITLGVMATIALTMLFFFRRKGWI